jgi:NRAMP (natural resistance-associated macrophage protein)-like metal ion transporter
LIYPFMAAIQEISARLGRVTGKGIAGNMQHFYPRLLLYPIIGLLLVANIINLGVDIGAMGAAVNLCVGGPTLLYCVVLAIVSLLLQIFVPYHRYAPILKAFTLSLLAYVATAFLVKIDWAQALSGTFVPRFSVAPKFLAALVAVLGTTISPYLFFWQAGEEVEEMQSHPREKSLRQAPRQMLRIKADTYVGMAVSNLIAYCIILVVAVTLNAQGKTDIDTPAQAAEALRPIAGPFASLLFSLGILGTGLLALPVRPLMP